MMGIPQDIEKTPYQTVQQVDNDVPPTDAVPHKKRTSWEKLGTYNVWVLILGTIVVFGAVGFLAFLWTVSIQQGSSSTKNPFGYFNTYKPRLWILILKEDWTARAVTLTTVLVRVALAAQLAVFAAIMAALILERVGASAQDLPLLSMIRCANTGPQALLWNVMHTFTNRSQLGFSVIIVVAILNALALQFMSTILLADFESQLVVLDSRNMNISWAVNNTANFVHTEGADYWRSSQTFYPSFAEHKEGASHGSNFIDTGMTYRGFLPFANQSVRESLKWYRGPMTVVNERVICVKPKLSEFTYELPDAWDDTISAKIDYNGTHPDVVQLPAYSNKTINCTMPYRDAEDPGYLHTSICRLGYGNGQMRGGMLPETDERSLNETNTWLMFKVSGPVDANWTGLDGPNVTVRRFPLRQVDSPEGPWAKLTAPNITIDVTSCVLNPEPEVYTIEAESTSGTTLVDTSLAWVTSTSRYDTDGPRWRFGVLSEAEISMYQEANIGRWTVEQLTSNVHRGIMTLKPPQNWPAVRTEKMTSTPYRRVIHGALEKNMHWAYSLSGNTNDSFVLTPKAGKSDAIHRKSMWLAQDILNQTNNPAFVLQTLSHIVLQTAYYDWYDSYDLVSGAIVATEERRSIPSTYNHILAVGALLFLHFVLIGQALFLFLTKTEMSLLGNAWQAVAQVSSNDTAVAVHHGTMSTDDEVLDVAKTSGFAHHRVVLKRSDRNGRLEATALKG